MANSPRTNVNAFIDTNDDALLTMSAKRRSFRRTFIFIQLPICPNSEGETRG